MQRDGATLVHSKSEDFFGRTRTRPENTVIKIPRQLPGVSGKKFVVYESLGWRINWRHLVQLWSADRDSPISRRESRVCHKLRLIHRCTTDNCQVYEFLTV